MSVTNTSAELGLHILKLTDLPVDSLQDHVRTPTIGRKADVNLMSHVTING